MKPIYEFAEAYGHAFESGDVEQVMQLATDDFVALTPDRPPLVGADAVRREVTADLQAMNVLLLRFEHEEVEVAGDWAYAWGRSEAKVVTGGETVEITGKYLWILKRQDDGSWKLARDSANGN